MSVSKTDMFYLSEKQVRQPKTEELIKNTAVLNVWNTFIK